MPVGAINGDDHVPPGTDATHHAWKKVYFRAPEGQWATHLHVRQEGRPNLRYPVLLREYMSEHQGEADAYAQIKLARARLHPTDVEAHDNINGPKCDPILRAAER